MGDWDFWDFRDFWGWKAFFPLPFALPLGSSLPLPLPFPFLYDLRCEIGCLTKALLALLALVC